ncbi:DNA-binding protein [Halomonas mongoliensis]|uniref:DNA-binding protein n=1 Tax=Halomonas mongoliensis TaxID=321265 RepID=A0ABU1GM07_9GAMM|nr:DNA-binding protein [Halomonas mongoliensis]MDR5892566.1 DNA-binding protein [Halomonas mongoliensis]
MARSGVQYEDVQRAIDDLLARGESPSVQKVREVLGTGSFTTISEHLREWRTRREENRDVPPPRGMPAALQELAEALWQKAEESANAALAHYREEADGRVEAAEARVAEARRQAEDASQREAALAAHLTHTEQRLEERSAALAHCEAERDQLDSRVRRLESRRAELEGLLERIRGEMASQAREHQQALGTLEAEQRERLAREEQRHESAEARLMGLLDEARQERQAQEKSAAAREAQLEKRHSRLEQQLQESRGLLVEEERKHRDTDWARRQAETLADTRRHEQALLQARVDEQKRTIEEQALRLRNLEEQLHRCLWQTPAAREEPAEPRNEEGPAAAEPSEK